MKTTVEALEEAINHAPDKHPVKITPIRMLYHDAWDDELKRRDETEGNVPYKILLARIKRKSFVDEKEIRLIAQPQRATTALIDGKRSKPNTKPVWPDWLAVSVCDLNWIQKIVVDESVDVEFAQSWLSVIEPEMAALLYHRGGTIR